MLRFLADASLHHAIVSGCRRREPAIDFLSAHEAELEGVPDPTVLPFAAQHDRILVTSDLRTMRQHFGDLLVTRGYCQGVFLVKQRARLADVIEELVMVWAVSSSDEWKNRSDFEARAAHVVASLPATIVREGKLLYDVRRVAA